MKLRTAAVLLAAALVPIITIPAHIATSAFDSASERELVQGYVRSVFVYTGRASLITRPIWFEWADLRTGVRYRMTKGEKLFVRFVDGSSVVFEFVGTAIGCPSGQCFTWMVGTERRGHGIVPQPPRFDGSPRSGAVRYEHPGTAGSAHSGPMMVHYQFIKPYNPYDESNWTGGRDANW